MPPSRFMPRPSSFHGRSLLAVLAATTCVFLCGCAAPQGGVLDKSLEAIGLKKPDALDGLKAVPLPQPTKVMLRIHAGEQLNVDAQKRSLSLVVKVYKLRSANAFLAAPYKTFGSPEQERVAFGSDVLDVRELVLTPGQRHEVLETLPPDASHLAVVALFRAPAEGRWRFAFGAKGVEKSGITLGLHGCAISVATGSPDGTAPESLRVAGVQCL